MCGFMMGQYYQTIGEDGLLPVPAALQGALLREPVLCRKLQGEERVFVIGPVLEAHLTELPVRNGCLRLNEDMQACLGERTVVLAGAGAAAELWPESLWETRMAANGAEGAAGLLDDLLI